MQFSNHSQEYIEFIYNHFNKCMLNKSINPNSNSIETIFFKNLFKQLKSAETYIHSDEIQRHIIKKYNQIETIKQMNFPTIYDSDFFPEIIKKNIELHTIGEIIYKTVLGKRIIKFHFFIYDNTFIDNGYNGSASASAYSIFDTYVNQMLMWIHILNSYYADNQCSQKLDIYIYLTDFKKILPSNNIIILSQQQINTGYTIVCSEISEIVIYRKEEWFKVFIHETFHNFGFDFSTMNVKELNDNISQLFPIKSKFNLYESYCEIWTRIINSAFCSYSILNNKNNISSFISYCDVLLQVERIFSLYQANKILNYIGIKYEHLYKKDELSTSLRNTLYKEKANVFAYYIISSILLNDYTKFIKWCSTNNFVILKFNKTPRTLQSFFKFIKDNYKNETYVKTINCIDKINHSNHFIKQNDFLKHSLRMTILELN